LLPGARFVSDERVFKLLYPLWWFGFRKLDLRGFDIVLSSSSYLAKFTQVPPNVPHICYLHNPFRYLWDRTSYKENSLPLHGIPLRGVDVLTPWLRSIDLKATQRLTHIIANSHHMADTFQKLYGRSAEVIYPPINVADFPFSVEREEFYLFVGRLLSYKRADLAIQACQRLGRRLMVVGSGFEENRLQILSEGKVDFLGHVSEDKLKHLYSRARALLFPGIEDFGLVPLEAQAAGCPVIAFGAGGALESVIEAETGVFFNQQSVESLIDAMLRFEKHHFDPTRALSNALRFDINIFEGKIKAVVNRFI